MPIRYLNTSVVTGQGSSTLFNNIPYQVTISNTSPSVSTVTGALVVAGGIGTSGDIYNRNLVASGNVSAFSASFPGFVSAGAITSFNINNAGEIISSSANIGIIETTNIIGGDGSFEDVSVSGVFDAYTINSGVINFTNSITGPVGAIGTLTSTDINSNTLSVNYITPGDSGSLNIGSASQLKITGGAYGQVLSTDGNGNLAWTSGIDQLLWGYGLTKNGQTVSLTQTGVTPGVYNSVNVDAYGRVLAGYTQGMSLQDVTDAGTTTNHQIAITNTTDATDTFIGALTVAGGIGVGATLFTESLEVVSSAIFNNEISVAKDITVNETIYLKGQTTGVVPIKFDSASLVGTPETGALEFTGSNLYITTSTGRKLVILRDSDAVPTVVVRAVTTYNISVSNPQQTVVDGGNTINAWDGLTLFPGDKVLLTAQTNAAENGVYVWTSPGVALIRSEDFDNARGVIAGSLFPVSEGTVNAGTIWSLDTPAPIVVGTTPTTFTRKVSKDNKALANLTSQQTGIVVRSGYGNLQTRRLTSGHSFLTISNATGVAGDINFNIGTLPVSKGGTGKTTVVGYMRGVGSAITSSPTIPYTDITGLGTIVTQNANNVTITGGTITVPSADISNLVGNTLTTGDVVADTVVADNITANVNLTTHNLYVTGDVYMPNLKGDQIGLGTNNQGSLTSNAANLSIGSTVTDSIAILNSVLGKLIPPAPPLFPGNQTISIQNIENYRMTDFVQADHSSTQNQVVVGGTTVDVSRTASFTTTAIENVGTGESGTLTAYIGGIVSSSVTLTSANNSGTYGSLHILNQDYHEIDSSIAAGFWSVITCYINGTVSQGSGWYSTSIAHSNDGSTDPLNWYADLSDPGTPTITNISLTPSSVHLAYSSTIPHYTSDTTFALGFNVNRLSGDTYPVSDEFVTCSSGGAFSQPANVSYATASIATPLARNLYVSSGSASINTICNVVSGFGSTTNSYGPTVTVDNSYHTATSMFTPNGTVLYKTGNTTAIDETNIIVAPGVGVGSANAKRIENPGFGENPAYTGLEALFNSETSTLETYDATVVGSVLRHNNTNYSVGYLPPGPNLTNQGVTQYFTFKITRAAVSKFDFKFTGTLAGAWVALPGSSIDTTAASTNGWLPLTENYVGAGVPGTGTGGNGYNGCAVGGVLPINTPQTEKSVTVTFGTETSSNATNNEIYLRIELTSGQSLTALSIEEATH